MQTKSFDVPVMYGDHHVSEVRRMLLEVPGVESVYASSAFRVVEVTFDAKKVKDKDIKAILQAAGYLGEWQLQAESGLAANSADGNAVFMRHTAVYESVKQVVTFSQTIASQGRPLWPCPGMGPINGMDEEK